MTMNRCEHFQELETAADPKSDVCDRCMELGDTWVHLRSCLLCGEVGCCDSSKNRHARKHWEEQGHPLIRSIEPLEFWQFCFPDKLIVK